MKKLVLLCTIFALLLCVFASQVSFAQTPFRQESKADRDARMQWWREARFGMFIHWGLYAVPGGVYEDRHTSGLGEWIMSGLRLTDEQNQAFAKEFNPHEYDPAEWVRIAKDAGMKYIVITSKHHEGFSIYDSKVSDYDVVDATPYGKDLIADLSAEAKKAGLKFGFYYSILDWHHPAQEIAVEQEKRQYADNNMKPGRKQEYIDYMKVQLTELVRQYDPDVLWFDGEWVKWWDEEDGRDLATFCWELNPDLIINNRVGKREPHHGDFGTPEQHIPDTGLGYDWETCMTINDTWGYRYDDQKWKSAELLIQNLVDIASKGGNYLLNVGPTKEGTFPGPIVERLAKMGDWMDVNGESIYGTSASPFGQPWWGRYTRKGNKIYAHIFVWPRDGRLPVPVSEGQYARAYLLADKSRTDLPLMKTSDGVTVVLPSKAPDLIDSVIVLEME